MSGPPSRKAKPRPDVVTDEQGRQRFHGAFTGGFSAGYYNTVGSEGNQGFQVSSYTSSRSQRAGPVVQNITNFIDAEDGLLGGLLATRDEFDTFDRRSEGRLFTARPDNVQGVHGGSNDFLGGLGGFGGGGALPAELVVASSSSVGKSLLRRMGWREGQGVGPRVAIDKVPGLASGGDGLTVAPKPLDNLAAIKKQQEVKLDRHGIAYSGSIRINGGDNLSNTTTSSGSGSCNLYSTKVPFGHSFSGSDNDRSRKLTRFSSTYGDDDDDVDAEEARGGGGRETSRFEYSNYEQSDEGEDDDANLASSQRLKTATGSSRRDAVESISSSIAQWIDGGDVSKDNSKKKAFGQIMLCPTDGRPVLAGFRLSSQLSSLSLSSDNKEDSNTCSRSKRDYKGGEGYNVGHNDDDDVDESNLLGPGLKLFSGRHSFLEKDQNSSSDKALQAAIKIQMGKLDADHATNSMTLEDKLSIARGLVRAADLEQQRLFEKGKVPTPAVSSSSFSFESRVSESSEAMAKMKAERELILKSKFGLDTLKNRFVPEKNDFKATTSNVSGNSNSNNDVDGNSNINSNKAVDPSGASSSSSLSLKVAAQKKPTSKGRSNRTTTDWQPAILLCRRFNVPNPSPSSNPNSGSGSISATSVSLGRNLLGQNINSSDNNLFKTTKVGSAFPDVDESYTTNTDADCFISVSKPDIAVFKRIFEDADADPDNEASSLNSISTSSKAKEKRLDKYAADSNSNNKRDISRDFKAGSRVSSDDVSDVIDVARGEVDASAGGGRGVVDSSSANKILFRKRSTAALSAPVFQPDLDSDRKDIEIGSLPGASSSSSSNPFRPKPSSSSSSLSSFSSASVLPTSLSKSGLGGVNAAKAYAQQRMRALKMTSSSIGADDEEYKNININTNNNSGGNANVMAIGGPSKSNSHGDDDGDGDLSNMTLILERSLRNNPHYRRRGSGGGGNGPTMSSSSNGGIAKPMMLADDDIAAMDVDVLMCGQSDKITNDTVVDLTSSNSSNCNSTTKTTSRIGDDSTNKTFLQSLFEAERDDNKILTFDFPAIDTSIAHNAAIIKSKDNSNKNSNGVKHTRNDSINSESMKEAPNNPAFISKQTSKTTVFDQLMNAGVEFSSTVALLKKRLAGDDDDDDDEGDGKSKRSKKDRGRNDTGKRSDRHEDRHKKDDKRDKKGKKEKKDKKEKKEKKERKEKKENRHGSPSSSGSASD